MTQKVGLGGIVSYGIGSIAYGIKDNGFSTFLMIYFNQVLGLPAYLVGIALLIAMLVDAISDPWAGYLSDRCTSRLGRRHPFMYASIVPIAITYYLLWMPPEASEFMLFLYLTFMSVAVRLTLTFFEIPNSALIGEISHDYDKRTAITGLRLMFGWLGGVIMAVIVYQVFLPDSVDYDPGILNPEGYARYAFWATLVMVVTMFVSAVGTQRAVKVFSTPDTSSEGYGFRFFKNVGHVFADSSFRSVFLASLCTNLVSGVAMSLQLYFGIFYFGLSSTQIALVTLTMVPAAIIAYLSTAFVVRGFEKKSVAVTLSWMALVLSVSLVVGKYFDVLPAPRSPELFYVVAILTFLTTTVTVLLSAVKFSMTIDLVDADQIRTGHRAEGLYFAAFSFTRKVVTGLGIFVSGVMLSLGAQSGRLIDGSTMHSIAIPYVVLIAVLYAYSIWVLKGFTLTRSKHSDNLQTLGKS